MLPALAVSVSHSEGRLVCEMDIQIKYRNYDSLHQGKAECIPQRTKCLWFLGMEI